MAFCCCFFGKIGVEPVCLAPTASTSYCQLPFSSSHQLRFASLTFCCNVKRNRWDFNLFHLRFFFEHGIQIRCGAMIWFHISSISISVHFPADAQNKFAKAMLQLPWKHWMFVFFSTEFCNMLNRTIISDIYAECDTLLLCDLTSLIKFTRHCSALVRFDRDTAVCVYSCNEMQIPSCYQPHCCCFASLPIWCIVAVL